MGTYAEIVGQLGLAFVGGFVVGMAVVFVRRLYNVA